MDKELKEAAKAWGAWLHRLHKATKPIGDAVEKAFKEANEKLSKERKQGNA